MSLKYYPICSTISPSSFDNLKEEKEKMSEKETGKIHWKKYRRKKIGNKSIHQKPTIFPFNRIDFKYWQNF
jgi:hypothetical protein